MKKKLIGFFIVTMFLLIGCNSDKLLSDDFKADSEQIISIVEEARENETDLSEDERELFNNFHDKYKYGQYFISEDEGYYEMNDLEKAIVEEVTTMGNFVYDYSMTATELASEKNKHDYYEDAKEQLDKLLKVKNIEKLPEEYKGKRPTYEKTKGVYPKQFEEDMNEFIATFDPIVNGDKVDVNAEDSKILEKIFNAYNMEGMDRTGVPNEYKQDDKYYLVNASMSEGIRVVRSLIADVAEGTIGEDTVEEFNNFKENIELLSR